jgi:hypothetical protein
MQLLETVGAARRSALQRRIVLMTYVIYEYMLKLLSDDVTQGHGSEAITGYTVML